MRVLLVTSWGEGVRCGIAEHSRMLRESVGAADQGITVLPSAAALDPGRDIDTEVVDLIHLNHHDALHSRWTTEHVGRYVEGGTPVVVTYHDTRAKLEECPKLQALAAVASATIVHEPVEGLQNAYYWRQGVPAPAPGIYHTGVGHEGGYAFKAFEQQPVLGSVGFNFPWKNFTRLAEVTGQMGWGLMLLAHDATEGQAEEWQRLNPHSLIIREFLSTADVIAHLAACDATAFMYECSNTGTSGAIRQGIAARKPVIAFSGCRQFRDLLQLDYGSEPGLRRSGILWADNWTHFREVLASVHPGAWDPAISHLADVDAWAKLGASYAALYRSLETKP